MGLDIVVAYAHVSVFTLVLAEVNSHKLCISFFEFVI